MDSYYTRAAVAGEEGRSVEPNGEVPRPVTDNASQVAVRRPVNQLRFGVAATVALLAFLVAYIALRGGDDSDSPPAAASANVVSNDDLASFARSLDHSVYWAGQQEGRSLELTRTTDGRVYVRYLPKDVKPGDRRARFLTVGTYPRATAFAELQRAAKAKGAVSVSLPNRGLMVFSESRPTSVYVGYPGHRYQIEVFHPSGDRARSLVLSGQVKPVR